MSKTVRVIPAKPKEVKAEAKNDKPLRVAAYCRVSTDEDEQQTSYENQIQYFTQLIEANPNWEMAGVYADDGISGTSTRRRTEFLKLMALCRRGRVDLILTKSVSRFARNTVDCLKYARLLKSRGVGIIFEKENINSLELSGELMLTLHASFAQTESESISKNVAMGHRMAMKSGKVYFQYKKLYGYKRGSDGEPEIIPEEAQVVRRMYYSLLAGYSILRIRDELTAENIAPPRGAVRWETTAIRRILHNEIYAGDVLRQKTYVSDCISGTVKKNTGELPQYYIMDNHEAIIPREVFNRVQEEFARRKSKPSASTKDTRSNRGKFSSKYALTDLMRCGECGTAYRRVTWPAKHEGGEKRIVWRCICRLENGKDVCKDSPTIPEQALHGAIMKAIRLLKTDQAMVEQNVHDALTSVIRRTEDESIEDLDRLIQKNENRMMELMQQQMNGELAETDWHAECTLLSNNVALLKERRAALLKKQQNAGNAVARIEEMMALLKETDATFDTYDDLLIRKIVEKITVEGADKLRITFIDGAEITQCWR